MVTLTIALPLSVITEIGADYVMPPFQTAVDEITTVVDATVVGLEDGGRVRIETHEVLRGIDPPTVLGGAYLTCLGVDLSRRLEVGRRYVMLLRGASLYEEGTFYEVRRGRDGLECHCWDGSEELMQRWMPVSAFQRLLEQATATAK